MHLQVGTFGTTTRCFFSSQSHTSTVASREPETIRADVPVQLSGECAKQVTTSRCPKIHCDSLPEEKKLSVASK